MAARKKKATRRPDRRHVPGHVSTGGKAGPWSEMRHAIADCVDTPPQYELTLKVVVRNNENLEEMDRALDDIRCYGSCEITECEALNSGDGRRLP